MLLSYAPFAAIQCYTLYIRNIPSTCEIGAVLLLDRLPDKVNKLDQPGFKITIWATAPSFLLPDAYPHTKASPSATVGMRLFSGYTHCTGPIKYYLSSKTNYMYFL
jgi:hypothetical protein